MQRRELLKPKEIAMKKLFVFAALAFALAVSTVTVITVYPQQALADPSTGCGGSGC
jgi:hypothetical protein